MDLSGFYMGGDDDDGQELSATLFSSRKRKEEAPFEVPVDIDQTFREARATLRRSQTQHPPAVARLPYRFSSLTSRTVDRMSSRGRSFKSKLSRNPSANSHIVSPLTPDFRQSSFPRCHPSISTAPNSPCERMPSFRYPVAELSRSDSRLYRDIFIILDLASPRLPPPLELPTTPEDYYTFSYDFNNSSPPDLSRTPSTRPSTSQGFYEYRLSSTTNVGRIAALRSRAMTPSGAWRYDAARHQDGLRMHFSDASNTDSGSYCETTPPRSPTMNGTQAGLPLIAHDSKSLTETLDISDTKPLFWDPSPPSPTAPSGNYVFALAACLGEVIVAAVLAQTLVPARSISESISKREAAVPGELMWMSAACIIAVAAFALPAAKITEYWGYKKIYIGSLIWLLIWTQLGAFGPDVQRVNNSGLAFLSACRAMQGIGIAFLGPTCFDMLHEVYPSAFMTALATSFGALSFVIGGVVAAAFTYDDNWKWSFVSLTVICLIFGVVGIVVLPPSPRYERVSRSGSLWSHLDALGMLSGGAGILLFCIGLNLLTLVAFRTPYPYLMMVVGVILFAWFLYSERFVMSPVLPFSAISTRAYLVMTSLGIYWAAVIIWLWYLIQILEHIRGWEPLLTSAGLVPLVISVACAFGTQPIIRRSSAELVTFTSCGLSFVGFVTMVTSETEIYWVNTFLSVLLVAPGTVMATLAGVQLLGENVAPRFPSSVTALAFGTVTFAMSIALGLAGTIEKVIGGESHDLERYRGPQYLGLGLSFLGLIFSMTLLISGLVRR